MAYSIIHSETLFMALLIPRKAVGVHSDPFSAKLTPGFIVSINVGLNFLIKTDGKQTAFLNSMKQII